MACGALLSGLVTLTLIGAGALGAVMLVYLYPLRLPPPRLIAIDIVHAISLAMFAGVGHLLMGPLMPRNHADRQLARFPRQKRLRRTASPGVLQLNLKVYKNRRLEYVPRQIAFDTH